MFCPEKVTTGLAKMTKMVHFAEHNPLRGSLEDSSAPIRVKVGTEFGTVEGKGAPACK